MLPLTTAQAPVDACRDPALELVCPNLRMAPPYDLKEVGTPAGRRLLLMGNRIVNVGPGPAELRGTRVSEAEMDARQIVQRSGGAFGRASLATGAKLTWKYVDRRRGDYWKLANAARFELWSTEPATGSRVALVRTGPKLDYCLRDLFRRRGTHTGRVVYPACSQKRYRRAVTLGISVDWADGYPAKYPENWIDVSGLAGCFRILQRADPLNVIRETDERDNTASLTVRLPYSASHPGPRCP
jgi:hypothetical protein